MGPIDASMRLLKLATRTIAAVNARPVTNLIRMCGSGISTGFYPARSSTGKGTGLPFGFQTPRIILAVGKNRPSTTVNG